LQVSSEYSPAYNRKEFPTSVAFGYTPAAAARERVRGREPALSEREGRPRHTSSEGADGNARASRLREKPLERKCLPGCRRSPFFSVA